MMRSMVLEFTEDKNCAYLASQYMLGDALLVAPVLNENSLAEYYLPEGWWTNYLTGEQREGGKWYREKHDYLSIPLYVKENSIVASGACDESAVYDYADGANFKVYAVTDGGCAKTNIYDTEAVEAAAVKVERTGNSYSVSVTSKKPCTVTLMNVGNPAKVDGAAYEMQEEKHVVLRFTGDGTAEVIL